MGLASSSALRVEEAYGSLGAPMGERKFKKKPVLVLDPDELAKAHQLFQIGAAEQLGEHDPLSRAPRPVAFLGLAAVADHEIEPPAATLDDEAEIVEDDLPPIDLDAILAMAGDEQDYAVESAEIAGDDDWDDFPAEEVAADSLDDDWSMPEPVASTPKKVAPLVAEPGALARLKSRAESARPGFTSLERDTPPAPVLQPLWDMPQAEEPAPPPAPVDIAPAPAPIAEAPAPEPVRVQAPAPAPAPVDEQPQRAAPPVAVEVVASSDEALDLSLDAQFDGAEFEGAEFEGEEVLPVLEAIKVVPIYESGPSNQLRARLVREDLPLTRPQPTGWRKLVIALRRLFGRTMP